MEKIAKVAKALKPQPDTAQVTLAWGVFWFVSCAGVSKVCFWEKGFVVKDALTPVQKV